MDKIDKKILVSVITVRVYHQGIKGEAILPQVVAGLPEAFQ